MAKPYGRLYQKDKNVSIMGIDTYDVWPVGSIFMSIYSTNPSTYFGGTWVKLSGGFIYASTATSGTKGESGNGSGTAVSAATGNTGSTTLTVNQIPGHTHNFRSDGTQMVNVTSGWVTNYDFVSINQGGGGYRLQFAVPTASTGGGQGHTHSLGSHTHNVPYIAVYVWKRTA